MWLIAPRDEISTKIMGKAIRNMSATGHRRKCYGFAKGEREKNTPFSMHFRTSELLDKPSYVERFLSMLRFKNREKLADLGLEIDLDTLKTSR